MEPVKVWYLRMNGADQLYSGWESKINGGCKEQMLMQFYRPDFVDIAFTRNLAEGDFVAAGDTVAVVYSDELNSQYKALQAELKQAQAIYSSLLAGSKKEELEVAEKNVERAKVAMESAKQDYERAKSLVEGNFTSEAEYQTFAGIYQLAEADWQLAGSQLRALQAGSRPEDIKVALAETERIGVLLSNLQSRMAKRTYITAPIGGIVLSDSLPENIIRIENIDTLAVEASFPEIVANFVQPGQQIQIKLPAQKDVVFTGVIFQVKFLKGSLSGLVVTALIANEQDRLMNGMTGRAIVTIKDQPLFAGLLDKLSSVP